MNNVVQKKLILIAEDEMSLLKILKSKCESEGMAVLEAAEGEEGLRLALKFHPDLILLDILMPKMDGITVLKRLREDKWGKTVPVIILTNLDANEKILQRVVSDHPAYYLLKSGIRVEEAMVKIKEVLDSQTRLN